MYLPDEEETGRTLAQDAMFMSVMVLILVFAAFAKPSSQASSGLWPAIFAARWYITAVLLIVLALMLKSWFRREERANWMQSTWGFMKQIFPLLGAGVLVAGFMLGRPGHSALIPEHYIQSLVGGNSVWAICLVGFQGRLCILRL